MTDHIRTFSELAPTNLCPAIPNAGLPDEEGQYLETPTSLAAQLERFVDNGWLNIVGGCCGTTGAAHPRDRADGARQAGRARGRAHSHRAFYSGIELVEAEDSTRPLIVGERTNVIGSRLFKNLVAEEKWEEATRDRAAAGAQRRAHRGRVPAKHGPRRNGGHSAVLREADSQDQGAGDDRYARTRAAMELALTYCQGKAIINSINLEDGEEKFARVCPLAQDLRRGGRSWAHR